MLKKRYDNMSIMMSDKPKWVAEMMNGLKTYELRKTAPIPWRDYLKHKGEKPKPMVVYIYCGSHNNYKQSLYEVCEQDGGGYDVDNYVPSEEDFILNGKVVAKFTLKEVYQVEASCEGLSWWFYIRDKDPFTNADRFKNAWELKRKSRVEFPQIEAYFENKLDTTQYGRAKTQKVGYVWQIDDLVIFDKPIPLNEFVVDKGTYFQPLTKAPQSWCYCSRNSQYERQ